MELGASLLAAASPKIALLSVTKSSTKKSKESIKIFLRRNDIFLFNSKSILKALAPFGDRNPEMLLMARR
jgi:hypothetical protein